MASRIAPHAPCARHGGHRPRSRVGSARFAGLAKLGPARIGYELGVAPSTVHRVLARHGISRLALMDRPTGRVIRRYERDRPGELVHVDIKKLGRLRDGGGWRAHGRQATQAGRRGSRVGFEYVHSAVDDHSRLAYSEILPDERVASCAGFLERTIRF